MTPVSNEEIEKVLHRELPDSEIAISGDGYQYQVSVISSSFTGKSTVQRHKLIYALLKQFISDGSLHALSLITKTPDECGR